MQQDLRAALGALSGVPAPHGAERPAAHALAAWGRRAHPGLGWEVDEHGAAGANVVVTLPGDGVPAVLLCSHLDTSLSGDPLVDAPVTGRDDDPAPLAWSADQVSGPGLGVARAPAAAALAGFAAAAARLGARPHRSAQLLLAGSGTHRSALPSALTTGPVRPTSGAGAEHHLRTRPRPDAVVVAKCGPPGVLAAEPGAGYLAVAVTGGWGAALAPASADPPGGVLLHTGLVLAGVAAWRAGFLAARTGRPDGTAAELGVGALTAGLPDKPDLLPARLDLRCYVVTVPGDDLVALAADLARSLREGFAGGPLAGCAVEVLAEPLHAAGVTDRSAPVVQAAVRAWTARVGTPPVPVQGWTGSTDGVVFRAAGIDTARLGPAARRDPADARRDVLDVAALEAFAEVYADVVVELAGS
ncbi:MAG: hypothetical protein F2825_02620 [Actinobacteria bacterium]|uniref:Unannotated protein n=1 Tax=freshwater metagenome TaxID=449393 RepID=A0A6J7GEI8_9ZZZZ|nr:hypothetical protein [Actinomycetota bacterium]